MHKFKIVLITLTDVKNFVEAVTQLSGTVNLEDEQGTYRVSAKSFMGAIAAIEDWNDVWVVSDNPNLYSTVAEFVV